MNYWLWEIHLYFSSMLDKNCVSQFLCVCVTWFLNLKTVIVSKCFALFYNFFGPNEADNGSHIFNKRRSIPILRTLFGISEVIFQVVIKPQSEVTQLQNWDFVYLPKSLTLTNLINEIFNFYLITLFDYLWL